MVLALAALAASAASFPTGFGFGAGYGAGVRVGYDVIYPKIRPFAAKITDDIIAAVDNLFGTSPVAQSSGVSGFDFGSIPKNVPTRGDERFQSVDTGAAGVPVDIVTKGADRPTKAERFDLPDLAGVRREVTFRQFNMVTGQISMFTGEMTKEEMIALQTQYENKLRSLKPLASRQPHPWTGALTASINSLVAARRNF